MQSGNSVVFEEVVFETGILGWHFDLRVAISLSKFTMSYFEEKKIFPVWLPMVQQDGKKSLGSSQVQWVH